MERRSCVRFWSIEGPALPPNGLALPMDINVSQNTALSVMGAGWLLALVAIQLLRRSRRSESTASEEDEVTSEDEDEKNCLSWATTSADLMPT